MTWKADVYITMPGVLIWLAQAIVVVKYCWRVNSPPVSPSSSCNVTPFCTIVDAKKNADLETTDRR